MPNLSRITVFPIKALDGHDLTESSMLPNGALAGDRRYALVDEEGKFISGKNCEALHRIRASFSENLQEVTLSSEGQQKSFSIADEQEALAAWCGEVLGEQCSLTENSVGGFPDDCKSPGPTLVSTATLEAVASWFDAIDLAEARRRFRFNLELADAPAFWEDGLVYRKSTLDHQIRQFRLGNSVWQGRGICMRCVVPTRDSNSGTVTPSFAREFARRREESLPSWAPRDRFDHFYRLGVNTRLDSGDNGSVLQLGDTIEVIK